MFQTEAPKDSRRITVELTMTVEEARQVIWQWPPEKARGKPFGEILIESQITYRDLAGAVLAAWDPKMKAAARTLLAYWLGEPATIEKTKRFGPQVVEGSGYLEEEQSSSLMIASLQMGVIIAAIIVTVEELLRNSRLVLSMLGSPSGILAFVIVMALLIAIGWLSLGRSTKQELDRYRSFRKGRQGEEAVVEKLRSVLDNHWTIFRNLHLPDRKNDLDVVLVGPDGVWVVEVKAYEGTMRAANGKWARQTKKGWVKLKEDPLAQVTRNATRLNDYLKRNNIVRYVERAIALSELQPVTNFDSPDVPIWLPPTIEEHVTTLTTRTPLTEKEIDKINELLISLAEKQLAIEATGRVWRMFR
jgi:nuclease-like protein